MSKNFATGQLGPNSFRAQGFLSPIRVLSEVDAARLAHKVAGIYEDYGAAARDYLGGNAHFIFPRYLIWSIIRWFWITWKKFWARISCAGRLRSFPNRRGMQAMSPGTRI